MNEGIWVWPSDLKMQRRTLRKVSHAPHLMTLLEAIAKRSDGLSNPEVSETLGNNSGWMIIWSIRQLLALGFIKYEVDLFGEASRYVITELGKQAAAIMSGQRPVPQAASH